MTKKRQPSSNDDDIKLSDLVGSSVAIVQHGIDLAVTAGLRSLKKAAEAPSKTKKNTNAALLAAAKFTKGFIGFLAQTGDSYMSTYEELKKDHKN